MRRLIFVLALMFLALPTFAGSFDVAWEASVWLDAAGNIDPSNTAPIRYEVGLGTQSRVYTTIEPSTDLYHGFGGLACKWVFVAVRACPASTADPDDCSEWSLELGGLPTTSQNVFCVLLVPNPSIPSGLVRADIN